jgi:hypothetical protein
MKGISITLPAPTMLSAVTKHGMGLIATIELAESLRTNIERIAMLVPTRPMKLTVTTSHMRSGTAFNRA